MFKQLGKTASTVMLAAGLAVTAGAAPATVTLAAEMTAFDRTTIEQDLAAVDLSVYTENSDGRHALLDDVGFMEYAYSSDSTIAADYFGLYFYVYNPTAREISTRAGANVVNMAVSYDAEGEPTEYANCAITILDYTDDHLIYKFKLTNSSGAYDRAKAYASAHDGVRRYDIAGIQLWFSGDASATDSNAASEERGITYRCTGYGKGCAADKEAESTLQIEEEKLDTISLDVEHTFWRTQTSSLGYGHQNQIDTVYFTVPNRYFEEYGTLQRVMAEWYEFRIKPAIVMEDDLYDELKEYIAVQLPSYGGNYIGYKSDDIEYSFYAANGSGYPAYLWNTVIAKGSDQQMYEGEFMQAFYLLFSTNGQNIESYDPYADINSQGGISANAIENYIYSYDKSFTNGTVDIKDATISADLFEEDIDESRKVDNERGIVQSGFDGISRYNFDIDEDVQTITSWADGNHNWWENGHEYGFWKDIPQEEGTAFAPIYIPSISDLSGSDQSISSTLMVQSSDVSEIKAAFDQAEDDGETLVLFRFAVTDYMAMDGTVSGEQNAWNPSQGEYCDAYIAQQTVFLNFDIIQLTFKSEAGNLTVIPVVADPIDIINPYTPPVTADGIDWALVAILAAIAVVSIVGIAFTARKGG